MNLYLLDIKVEDQGPFARAQGEGPSYESGIWSPDEQPLRSASSDGNGVRVLLENEELLARYLSCRRLAQSTRESYGTAMRSFSDLVGAPLVRSGRDEFEEWFRQADRLGLAAGTIALYMSRLRKVKEQALIWAGLSRVEARATGAIAMEAIPLGDLRRETKRSSPGRENLVTTGELDALRKAASHPRARALVDVMYESACRKGEILGLRVRDVTRSDRYIEIRVLGKTGERTLPLVRSAPSLEAWLDAHPDPRPAAPLFATVVDGQVRQMEEHTPNRLLRDLCRRAGIRPIHPHMLRHTRLTELARAGLGEYQLKSFAGWTADSDMAARYVHLSGRAHVEAVLRADGVAIEEAGQGVGA